MMSIIAVAVIGGMFVTDNAEYFDSVEKNKADGMTWEYVGPHTPSDADHSLPVISPEGKETIYFKLTK